MGRKKETYSLDFKKKCIGQLLDGKAFAQVCTDNCIAPRGLKPTSLGERGFDLYPNDSVMI